MYAFICVEGWVVLAMSLFPAHLSMHTTCAAVLRSNINDSAKETRTTYEY